MASKQAQRDFKIVLFENMPDSVLEDAIAFIRSTFEPEEVFSETELEKWAEANGYVKADQP